eukprot:770561-Rhodomonas_salina.1
MQRVGPYANYPVPLKAKPVPSSGLQRCRIKLYEQVSTSRHTTSTPRHPEDQAGNPTNASPHQACCALPTASLPCGQSAGDPRDRSDQNTDKVST